MIGFIARSDLGGLGIESRAFVKHVKPDKVMVIKIGNYTHFPNEFPGATVVSGIPTDEQYKEFLKGLDVLFCIETPYNWKAFKIAREMNIKTILRVNYEWLPEQHEKPDLYIYPIDWNSDKIDNPKILLQFPVDTEEFPFSLKTRAHRFLHIAGHQGGYGRNGTLELLEAMKYVKSDIKLIVYSQQKINQIDDPRIEWRIGNFEKIKYDADVFVFPRRYAGQALSMNEAMACGLAVMMTDMDPQNKILPKELLIKPSRMEDLMVARKIEIATIDPKEIAKKIDAIAGKDITKFSKQSKQYADKISWKLLLKEYKKICQQN